MPDPTTLPPATWGRRIAALCIDWAAANLVTVVVLGGVRQWQQSADTSWIVLLVFFVEVAIGTALAGGSFGQLALRLRVLRRGGGPLGLYFALVRTALICLVVPPLIFKPDGRGLHDLAVDSATYRVA